MYDPRRPKDNHETHEDNETHERDFESNNEVFPKGEDFRVFRSFRVFRVCILDRLRAITNPIPGGVLPQWSKFRETAGPGPTDARAGTADQTTPSAAG